MTYYLVIFAAGFLGSFHCIGMCGGFACALGRDPRGGAATVERHLLYNLGRLTTYCFLGALAGALGQAVSTAAWCGGPIALRSARHRAAGSRRRRRAPHDRHGAAVLRPVPRLPPGRDGLWRQHARPVAPQPARHAEPRRRRSPLACSTASCPARSSMPSPPRRRARPRRSPAFSSCWPSASEPFPPC